MTNLKTQNSNVHYLPRTLHGQGNAVNLSLWKSF